MASANKHIVVIGAGFGGLAFCRKFQHPDYRITVVDRQNHHLFQPLLYQVATAGLSMPEIAMPIRKLFSRRRDISVLQEEVTDINPAERRIRTRSGMCLSYDYLVFAAGARTHYFGQPEWERFAPGLKSLDDAMRIRRNLLLAFERAEATDDPELRKALMTMVVIGGGPTGVELAGAFAELRRFVLQKDFRRIDPRSARVILLEVAPRVLGTFGQRLADSARRQLESLGVEVRLNARIAAVEEGRVVLESGETIAAGNIVWGAGVRASDLCARLGAETDKSGRLKVLADLSLPSHPEVFVIGDCVTLVDVAGRPVPGVSPAAMQMGGHVARLIRRELQSGVKSGAARQPFRYRDKGNMATIGRSRAVAKIGPLSFSGFTAWLAWLFIHLVFLVGFRNRLVVMIQWFYSYVNYKRGARIINGIDRFLEMDRPPGPYGLLQDRVWSLLPDEKPRALDPHQGGPNRFSV